MGATVWNCASASSEQVRTVVLVGKIGNGKSATGNSILGEKVFQSKISTNGVTGTCQMQATELADGKIINVIDTPGLFDYSRKPETIKEEILKCIKMTKDGIHAVLFVLSVRSRFSEEEKCALDNLLGLFGKKVCDYMIVVFTGGDEFEEGDETFDEYLEENCSEAFQDILKMCGQRSVLFDNRTKNRHKKSNQVMELLKLIEDVVLSNGGKPYTNEPFLEQKVKGHEEDLKILHEMVDSKVSLKVSMLKVKLVEERVARRVSESMAKVAKARSDEEIRKLKEELKKGVKKNKELKKELQNKSGKICTIL